MITAANPAPAARHPIRLALTVLMSIILLLAGTLARAQTATDEEAAPAIDPAAAEIVSRANAFLSGQQSLQVDWFISYDTVVDGREKITYIRSGTNLLARGVGFYSASENGPQTREYFFDGTTFTVYDVEDNAYATAKVPGSFENLVDQIRDRYDITLPIWQMLSQRDQDDLLSGAERGAYLGETRIAGQAAHHLAFSNYDSDWQVWVSTDPERPVPLMIVGTDPYKQGWPQYRAYFTGWTFDPEIPDGTFSYVPDDDADQMTWPVPDAARTGGE